MDVNPGSSDQPSAATDSFWADARLGYIAAFGRLGWSGDAHDPRLDADDAAPDLRGVELRGLGASAARDRLARDRRADLAFRLCRSGAARGAGCACPAATGR